MTNIIPTEKSIQKIIAADVAKATTIAALPIPLIDSAGVMFVQYQLIEKLANAYGKQIDNKKATLITTAISAITAKLITDSLNRMSKKVKINKYFGRSMVSAMVVTLFTSAIGELFHLHFKNGGTLEDFGIDAVTKYVQMQIATEKLSIENIGSNIVQKVVNQIS